MERLFLTWNLSLKRKWLSHTAGPVYFRVSILDHYQQSQCMWMVLSISWDQASRSQAGTCFQCWRGLCWPPACRSWWWLRGPWLQSLEEWPPDLPHTLWSAGPDLSPPHPWPSIWSAPCRTHSSAAPIKYKGGHIVVVSAVFSLHHDSPIGMTCYSSSIRM